MNNAIRRLIRQQRPFTTLEEEVFVGLQLAANRLMEPWADYLRDEVGITEAQYNVLRILRGAGDSGLRVQELAGRLITRSPDVTRLIDRLVKLGLVERRPDPADGRAVRLHVTAGGLERIAPLDSKGRSMLKELLGPVSSSHLGALRDELNGVLEALSDRTSAG